MHQPEAPIYLLAVSASSRLVSLRNSIVIWISFYLLNPPLFSVFFPLAPCLFSNRGADEEPADIFRFSMVSVVHRGYIILCYWCGLYFQVLRSCWRGRRAALLLMRLWPASPPLLSLFRRLGVLVGEMGSCSLVTMTLFSGGMAAVVLSPGSGPSACARSSFFAELLHSVWHAPWLDRSTGLTVFRRISTSLLSMCMARSGCTHPALVPVMSVTVMHPSPR